LTTKLDVQDGARMVSLLFGDENERYVLGSEEGYGFLVRLGELASRQRAGKAVITLERQPLVPARVHDPASDRYALATAEGRLLVFPISELPELAKGKGNKLVMLKGEDRIVASAVLPANAALTLVCGKRTLTLKPGDLGAYLGARASRGGHLPRGFQTVEAMSLAP
jgi:topoisomerase-4 subunit A